MYGHAHRRCKLVSAAVGSPVNAVVDFVMGGVYGGIVGKQFDNRRTNTRAVTLRTVPLANILEQFGAPPLIDYFSLDVEGAEGAVMQDFPFDKYKFLVISVERPKSDLKKLLSHHGYHFLRLNSWFKDETWISARLPDFNNIMHLWNNMRSNGTAVAHNSCMLEEGYQRPSTLK